MATPEGARHRDVEQRFRDLERKHRELVSRALQRPKYAVTEGDLTISGGALIVNGGDFLLLDTDGSTVFRLGPQDHGDRGVTISREDGGKAIEVSKLFPNSTDQTFRIRDKLGTEIVSEEALGSGLARPWLHIPLQPVTAASSTVQTGPYGLQVQTTATTWTTTHQAWYGRHNQYGSFRVRLAASDTTTEAQVRVINAATGDVLARFLEPALVKTRAAGSTGYTEVLMDELRMPGAAWSSISVAVQVLRTAGTGTLTVAVPESRGGVDMLAS